MADFIGIDGDYVERAQLMVPAARFQPADLTNPPHLDRTFDLAVCLEVGEHLPKKSIAEARGLANNFFCACRALLSRDTGAGRNEPYQ